MDTGQQKVTTVQLGDKFDFVASKHAVYSDSSTSPPAVGGGNNHLQVLKSYTRGSILSRDVANPDLLACFRNLAIHVVPEGDKIIFACEIKIGGSSLSCKYYFVVICSTRDNASKPKSCALVVSTIQNDELDNVQVILGIPIVPSMNIEFKGRGVFGISFAVANRKGLYFETLSMHSMWTAIVSLEKVRDDSKVFGEEEIDFQWMTTYFPDHNKNSETTKRMLRSASLDDSSEPPVLEPDEEGEGGRSIFLKAENLSNNHLHGAEIWESVFGAADRMFSLQAIRNSLPRPASSPRNFKYEKPDFATLSMAVFDIVGSAPGETLLYFKNKFKLTFLPDPDAISMNDISNSLKERFGDEVIGKQGYSGALLDNLIYKAYGQLEQPTLIIDGLYLGSEHNAANKSELKRLGVTHILNVTVEVEKFFENDFKYHQVCVLDRDTVNLLPFLDRAIEFIDTGRGKSNGAVLVHCQRGVSRSATFVIAYLMFKQGITAEDATKFVKEKRRVVKPNKGFVQQLKEFEQKNITQ